MWRLISSDHGVLLASFALCSAYGTPIATLSLQCSTSYSHSCLRAGWRNRTRELFGPMFDPMFDRLTHICTQPTPPHIAGLVVLGSSMDLSLKLTLGHPNIMAGWVMMKMALSACSASTWVTANSRPNPSPQAPAALVMEHPMVLSATLDGSL